MPIFLVLVIALLSCPVSAPVAGPVVRPFEPVGDYGGHWGVDFAVPVGTPVHAVAAGVVTFAGPVAGRLSVTLDHGGFRTSYSYLAHTAVHRGRVEAGEVIGRSGVDRGAPALHLSLRVGDRYVDPMRLLRCALQPPAAGVRLLPGADAFVARSRRP